MFYIYALLLILSGIAMLVMALVRTDYAKRRQVVNFILGAGFTIYGLYLLLAFQGGHYVIFYYVFVLPILMIVQFFRDRTAARSRRPSPGQPYSPVPGQGYGQASNPASQQGYNPAQQQGYAPQQAYNQGYGQAPAAAPWAAGPETGNGQPSGYPHEPNRDRW
jgi:predicted lipid-binding transport protein (Tim44 family)